MKHTRYSVRFISLMTALLLVSTLQAGEAPRVTRIEPPESILFIGNSFTFYNNAVYSHLRGLLVAEDPALRRRIFLKSMTISGAVLADHRGGLRQMLENREWDVIVLQGHSREPIDSELSPGYESALAGFSALIRSGGAEPVLFMTWAYADRPAMITELGPAFTRSGNQVNALVVPVGLAFESARREIPGVTLHHVDKIHPSLEGTYLAAAVFYSSLFRKSPLGLSYTAGLDERLARELRRIAWQTVTGYYGVQGAD